MSDRVVLERFQGFTDGALDGYAAGVAVRRIGGPAEANLRALPPLDRELGIEIDGERAVLRDGESAVIEVTATGFEFEIPPPLTLAGAESASRAAGRRSAQPNRAPRGREVQHDPPPIRDTTSICGWRASTGDQRIGGAAP